MQRAAQELGLSFAAGNAAGATAVRPMRIGLWDRYGLWTIVAIVLVALAYAYPLLTLIAQPRYGSPPFQPF